MLLGILIVLIGIVLLFRNLGVISLPASFWDLFYPIILIVVGVYFVMVAQKGKKYWDWIVQKFLKKPEENK